VSTPIGNLQDLSPRAIEALQNADYILCEDTRRAQKLKTHFGLKPRLVSLHEHNEKTRIPRIIRLMVSGKSFALISDAGTPLVSDPGYALLQEVIREGLSCAYIPGPSAVIAALVISGFPAQPFSFYGFLPKAPAQRKKILQDIAALHTHTAILFESPDRIVGLVREIGEITGDRSMAICRELTKMHEEVIRGKTSEVLAQIATRSLAGEITVVISPGEAQAIQMSDDVAQARFDQLLKEGFSRKDGLKKLVKESGRSRNDLYRLIMTSSPKRKDS
jgi:16S rRNA (cytidine1402-2'-O)-methyltransferase